MICNKCKHKWDYQGKSKVYITCPQCMSKIKKNKKKLFGTGL